jgi:hypothetical protein
MFSAINLLIITIGSSFWKARTWEILVVETPAALVSSIIPWKIVSEYQLLNINTKLLFNTEILGSLNISVFVLAYNIN